MSTYESELARNEELQALRAKRQAVEDQIAREAEERRSEAAIERERRALADTEALHKAITEHGALDIQIATVETDFGLVIVKRASGARYRAFQDKGEYTMQAVERLVRPGVLHPTLTEFDRWCDDQPAILIRCSDKIAMLGGVRKQEVEKK